MRVSDPVRLPPRQTGFTLVELLTVIAILVALASLSVPALQTVRSASMVDRAVHDLLGTVELARMYAMAHHTYVRVGFSDASVFPGSNVPSTVVVSIYSVDGTLDAADSNDMADASKWKMLGKAMVLSDLKANDALGASSDDLPSKTNIARMQRQIGALGTVSFDSFIQCNPNGETSVSTSSPSRYIKMGWGSASAQNNKNSFVLRLSGINGSIIILRQENL